MADRPMPTSDTLAALRARIEAAQGAERGLDVAICLALYPNLRPPQPHCAGDPPIFWDAPFEKKEPPRLTGSLDAVAALIAQVLPGWWWSTGHCYLSGDASMGPPTRAWALMGPDHNDPAHKERLSREWPEEQFHEGFHLDRREGEGVSRQCLALLECVVDALLARTQEDGAHGRADREGAR